MRPISLANISPYAILTAVFGFSLFLFLLVMLFQAQLYVMLKAPSYLIFHNIVEFFSVMVSLSIFSVGWYTFAQSKNRYALFLGTAFLAIGLIDFMHTLSFPGMPDFVTPSSTNKGILFWIAARIISAGAFFVSAFIYPETSNHCLSRKNLLAAAIAVSGMVFISDIYFPGYLPVMFVEGSGLTPVKIYLEYFIIGMLILSFAAYWNRLLKTEDRILILYLAALIMCIFSELAFTLYKSAYDTYNMLGHIYKLAAFFLIYRALFTISIQYPYIKLVETGEKLREEIDEHKRAEVRARISEEKFLKAFRLSPIALTLARVEDGVLVEANHAFEGITGYSVAETLGKTAREFDLFPDLRERPIETLKAKKQMHNIKMHLRHKSGELRVVQCSAEIMIIGGLEYILSATQDITEREKSEETLREQYSIIHGIIDSTNDFIFSIDRQYRYTSFNRRHAELMKLIYGAEIKIGSCLLDYMTVPLDKETARNNLDQALAGKQLVEEAYSGEEFRLRRYFRVSHSPIKAEDGKVIGVAAISQDITERKQAEDILRRSEEKYRTIYEESFDGLFITSPGGKILDMNKKGIAMFGYDTKEEILSLDLERDVYAYPQDRKRILEMVNREGSAEYEVVVKKKNGEKMTAYCTLTAVKDERGTINSYRGIIRDITERKQVEEALNKNEKELREAQRLGRIGNWSWDVTTDTITWSKEYYRIYGFDPSQRPPGYEEHLKAYTPESAARLDAAVKKNIQTGEPYELDLELANPKGPCRWITARSETLYDSNGKIAGLRGTAQDITERKKAEEALRGIFLYTRSLIEASLDPLVTISKDGKITDVNKATEVVTGLSYEKLVGSDFSDYFTEPEKAREGYCHVFEKGFVKDYPLAIRHVSGNITDVLYNAVVYKDIAGNISGVFAAARDITERKKVEEALRESEERYRALIENINLGVCLIDKNYKFMAINGAFSRMFGVTKDQVKGKHCFEICAKSDSVCAHCPGTKAMALKKAVRVESECVCVDNTRLPVILHTYPILDSNNDSTAFIKISEDISEYKKVEQAKKNLIRDMSHSLKTPIAMTEMAFDIIKKNVDSEDKENIRRANRIALENLVKLRKDVNNILREFSIDVHKNVIGKKDEISSLSAALKEVSNNLGILIERKNLQLEINIPSNADIIKMEDRDIKTILNNLLDNAIKFTDKGKIFVASALKNGMVEIEVKDTGCGISPKDINRVFDKFYKRHAAVEGTGLGLSICRELVEMYKGEINIYSEGIGKGVAVIVKLPMA